MRIKNDINVQKINSKNIEVQVFILESSMM